MTYKCTATSSTLTSFVMCNRPGAYFVTFRAEGRAIRTLRCRTCVLRVLSDPGNMFRVESLTAVPA